MSYYDSYGEIYDIILEILRSPLDHPDILPTVLPLIAGAIVIELYFGKHKSESLGWNTSVGNAVIWVSTGITLYMTESLSQPELYATYGLIGLGIFVAYMDFFHKWSEAIAFTVSSAGVVYTLAYLLVVFVKTDLTPSNNKTLYAVGVFFFGTLIVFKILQGLETDPRQNQFGMR
jgi:uncharacterized RDD family membrane protein YckC